MYGYLVNELISIKYFLLGRYHFNFIQLDDNFAKGNVINEYNLSKLHIDYLNNAFKRGVRLFHLDRAGVNFNEYYLDNAEVDGYVQPN